MRARAAAGGLKEESRMFGNLKSPTGEQLVIERYVIEMFLGPNFIPNTPIENQPGIVEHLLYFGKQILEGYVLIAGPYRAFDGAYVVLSEKVTSYEQAVQIMEGDPWNEMGMSVAVVRILDTNPVLLPQSFKIEPARPVGGKGRTRTVKASRRRAAPTQTAGG
jgi:hypothetical protein